VTPRKRPLLPSEGLPRTLAIATLGFAAVGFVINTVISFLYGPFPLGWLGPVVCVSGVLLGFHFRYVGLAITMLAPVLAMVSEQNPTGTGILAVCSALLLTLNGAPAPVVGIGVAAANFVATGMFYGPEVFATPLPSVAAIGAMLAASFGSAVLSRGRARQADQKLARDAVISKQLAIERMVADERVRIARDLHDSIGHRIAVVSMHVGAAEVQLEPTSGSDNARASLVSARAAIREVLSETQEILRMLRNDGSVQDAGPSVDFASVPALVESFTTAGLPVIAEYQGAAHLPHPVTVAVYRIVQEALTNAQRHGHGTVHLVVQATAGGVTLDVENEIGTDRAPALSGGRGLVGMRERAKSVGGWVESDTVGGRHHLTAWLPINDAKPHQP
jgi:signal transduction histidine kinase